MHYQKKSLFSRGSGMGPYESLDFPAFFEILVPEKHCFRDISVTTWIFRYDEINKANLSLWAGFIPYRNFNNLLDRLEHLSKI